MYHCNFSEKDKKIIRHARIYDPNPAIRKRMGILWYKVLGYPHYEIARLSEVCNTTVTATLRRYQEGGIEKIRQRNPYRPQSELQEYRAILVTHFSDHPPASLNQAATEIERLTGLKRSPSSVRTFLVAIGMYRRKVGMVPGKADQDKQEEFINKKLQPVLDEAREGKRQVYFVDAAHFVLAPFLGFLWSFTRLFVKAPAGRNRFNILGALNAITHEIVTVRNDTYINALSICELFRELAARNIGVAITLILDNARYQKCAIVSELARTLNIDLLYLPPYSPNLNIIERLWKFVKKEVLYSKYYADFPAFKNAISKCLEEAQATHKSKLDSLLSLKFQRFKISQMAPA